MSNDIHKKRWAIVYIWIIVFTGLTVLVAYNNHRLAVEGSQTHTAICSFRDDLGQRIKDSQKFLLKHPNGVPGLASHSDIVTSIVNEQATYQSLADLNCS